MNDGNNLNFVCFFKETVNNPVIENMNFTISLGFHFRDKSTNFGKIQ